MLLSELNTSAARSIEESESNVIPHLDRVARGNPPADVPAAGSCFLAVCFVFAIPCRSEHSLLVFIK